MRERGRGSWFGDQTGVSDRHEVANLSFLGRAKKFLQDLGTEPAAKTQYFNVTCASGHRVRGERTEGYQALRCPACGEGVFVLPRSPLPEPVAPSGGVPGPRRTQVQALRPWMEEGPVELTDPVRGTVELDDGTGREEAEIVWEDEPDEVSPRPVASASPRAAPEDFAAAEIDAARRAETPVAGGEGRRAGIDGRTAPRGAVPRTTRGPAEPRGAARSARPRHETAVAPQSAPAVIEVRTKARGGPRIGLIFLGLALAVAAAFGLRAWKQYRARYPLIAQRGLEEGIPALNAGEFDRAHQLLHAARTAVDALGGHIEGAEDVRRAADEAAIYVDLCPQTLEDMLAEAGRGDPAAWESKFETHYKGRYLLFDTRIEATPAESGTGAYEIAYVVVPPGEASRFGDGRVAQPDRYATIDLAGFELLEGLAKDAHVTFGARLSSIAYDSESKHWVVRLEPKSGVFITHHQALEALGFPSSEAVDRPGEDRP